MTPTASAMPATAAATTAWSATSAPITSVLIPAATSATTFPPGSNTGTTARLDGPSVPV